jgi:hypothetical protein
LAVEANPKSLGSQGVINVNTLAAGNLRDENSRLPDYRKSVAIGVLNSGQLYFSKF